MSTISEPKVKDHLDDIQGWIVSGYKHMEHGRFLYLRIRDAEPGNVRKWLDELVPNITTGARRPKTAPKPTQGINIALEHSALAALGVPERTLVTFSTEFQQGVHQRGVQGGRSVKLGDTGGSAPSQWEIGGPDNEFDILLFLSAGSEDRLEEHTSQQVSRLEKAGIKLLGQDAGHRLPGLVEHFGFRDGISQPAIMDSGIPPRPGQLALQAGEFILGYLNEYGRLPPTPSVSQQLDPARILHDSAEPGRKDLGRNGTYLVFRKLEQDTAAFWEYMKENSTDADDMVLIASKCVGRWPDGTPLVLSPDRPNEAYTTPERINNFLYKKLDPHGTRCPVASHIRRTNPRDSLDALQSLELTRRHSILRRAMPYGDLLQPGEPDDKQRRGLLFFAINSDIRRQFEFQQASWCENKAFNGLFDSKDPVIGANDDGEGKMEIPAEPGRRRLTGMSRFVHVKGAAYLFLPSLRALRFLAALTV